MYTMHLPPKLPPEYLRCGSLERTYIFLREDQNQLGAWATPIRRCTTKHHDGRLYCIAFTLRGLLIGCCTGNCNFQTHECWCWYRLHIQSLVLVLLSWWFCCSRITVSVYCRLHQLTINCLCCRIPGCRTILKSQGTANKEPKQPAVLEWHGSCPSTNNVFWHPQELIQCNVW